LLQDLLHVFLPILLVIVLCDFDLEDLEVTDEGCKDGKRLPA
jgi:hypothetical protein